MENNYNLSYWIDNINDILESFDFDRVYKCMIVTDWTWAKYLRTPTVDEMKDWARSIMEDTVQRAIAERYEYFISSGGFSCRVNPENGYIRLSFDLVSVDRGDY